MNKHIPNRSLAHGRRAGYCAGMLVVAAAALWSGSAGAQALAMSEQTAGSTGYETFANRSFRADPDANVPTRLHRQIVNYSTSEAPGTIIVDTPNTYLYFVLGGGIHAKMPRWKNLEIIVQEYRSVTIAARPLPSLQLPANRPAQNPWRCSASHR